MAATMTGKALARVSFTPTTCLLRGASTSVAQQRSAALFSTSKTVLTSNGIKHGGGGGGSGVGAATGAPSGNPEMPAFSLKHLSTNPGMRRLIIALLLVAGCAEGASWVYFWPKVFGKGKGEEGDVSPS